MLLRRDGEVGGREGEREQNVLFLLAEDRSATLEAVLCRGPYILGPGSGASRGVVGVCVGGVKERWGGVMRGLCCWGVSQSPGLA